MDALTAISTRQTPQSEPADHRQVPNAAGGHGFKLGDDARVHRFLTLGTDGGTYYTSERDLTKANADVILRAARDRGTWLVEQIVAVSTAGRAPRQNPAVFALAAASALADDAGRKAALDALPAVCRTGTHLFLFATYVEQFRGWGRGLRKAIARWYTEADVDRVAYQAVKYRQREGWSHRDLLRLAHPDTDEPTRKALFDWIARRAGVSVDNGTVGVTADLPDLIGAFEQAQVATDVRTWERLISEHPLSWEMLPDAALTEPVVWHSLVRKGMPQTALMRQLPRLTRLGVLDGETLRVVTSQLADPERLRKARVHPVNVLIAQRTYAQGQGARGQQTWQPKRQVVDALDSAFYASFGTVEPAGKRTLLALDVSGSMTQSASGLPVSCREVSAALALVTMASEPECDVVGFTAAQTRQQTRVQGLGYDVFGRVVRVNGPVMSSFGGFGRGTAITELSISPRQRLDDAIRAVSDLPFGGTDCSLPFTWAQEQGKVYDTFVVLTDSETWAGGVHPHQALARYREQVNRDARLCVVGMTASDVSIADPTDSGSLDVAGFDAAVPNMIADFSRGSL